MKIYCLVRRTALSLLLTACAALLALGLTGCGGGGGGSTSMSSGGSSSGGSEVSPVAQVPVPEPPPGDTREYVGSARCSMCHASIYATFMESGHPYKVSKVVDGKMPTYPFSSIAGALEQLAVFGDDGGAGDNNGTQTDNTLGTPTSYDLVSYVIGGYGWKARWMDKNGFIATGKKVQYNINAGPPNNSANWSAYNNNSTDKKFDCGDCHTTGWRYTDATLNPNRQDGLPGMAGTFEEPGVRCEACHGAGSKHVVSKSKDDIVRDATWRTTAQLQAADQGHGLAVSCGECHTRDSERPLSANYVSAAFTASGGVLTENGRMVAKDNLSQHHQQGDEILAVNPDNITGGSTHVNPSSAMWQCKTCHDPHKSTRYKKGGARSANADCMTCHANKDPQNANTAAMRGLNCIDCHMPKLVKSATSTAKNGDKPLLGDIRIHIFAIDMTRTSQFTADGKFLYPWITPTYACKSCHDGSGTDLDGINLATYKFHQ